MHAHAYTHTHIQATHAPAPQDSVAVHAIECSPARLECARANLRALRDHLAGPMAPDVKVRASACERVSVCVCADALPLA